MSGLRHLEAQCAEVGAEMSSAEIEELAEGTDAMLPNTNSACTDPECTATDCSHPVSAEDQDADELGRFMLRGLKIEDMRYGLLSERLSESRSMCFAQVQK